VENISEICATRWLLWHSDLIKSNFGGGCTLDPAGEAYENPPVP